MDDLLLWPAEFQRVTGGHIARRERDVETGSHIASVSARSELAPTPATSSYVW
jgi:hypothetical protein